MQAQQVVTKEAPKKQVEVIPAAVVTALDAVREAATQETRARTTLVVSIVRLYLECRKAHLDLTGAEVARRTGASAAYVSAVWRAAENASRRRRIEPVAQAETLGYKGFVRKFLPSASPRSKTFTGEASSAEAVGTPPLIERAEALRAQVQRAAAHLTDAEKQNLLMTLLGAVEVVQHAIHRIAVTPAKH